MWFLKGLKAKKQESQGINLYVQMNGFPAYVKNLKLGVRIAVIEILFI